MSFQSFFGFIALVTSVIGLVPQSYKAFKTRSTNDVSMFMVVNFLICSIAWIIYGVLILSVFVVLSNIVSAITCAVLIVQKHYYDSRRRKPYVQ